MIVITGASGKTGSKVAELLLEKKMRVRVLGRSHDHLKSLGEKGAEIMTGDQADPAFLANAFRGAEAAYLQVPSVPGPHVSINYYNTMGNVAISAIKKAKIRKVVFLSSFELQIGSWIGPVHGLHVVERKLDVLKKVDIMVLRAGILMENLLKYIPLMKNSKPSGNESIQIITAREIGEKVANLLENPVFKGHSVLELSGQKWFFYPRLSLNVNRVSGLPPDEAAMGASSWRNADESQSNTFRLVNA